MAQKTSGKEETTPPVILRRSPRFQKIVLVDPYDPKTPNLEQHRRTRSVSSATPISSTGVSPRTRSERAKSKQCSQKLDESCNPRQRFVDSKRLNRCVDDCSPETLPRGSDRCNGKLEKRVTRSSGCKDLDNTSHGCSSGEWKLEAGVNRLNTSKQSKCKSVKNKVKHSNTSHGCSSGERKLEAGVNRLNTSKQSKCKSVKNKVKHSKKSCDNNPDQFDTLAYDDKRGKPVLSITENRVLDEGLSKKEEDKIKNQVAVTTAVVGQEGLMNVRDVDQKQKNIGVKRTRNQFENITRITQGWTKDQESALERAYLEAKPTPHFWKKVSRLVPGKSAQECFDKIHGSHLTPPQPRIRSRARVANPQNPSFSASKLLKTSSPTKRPRYRKQKSHIIQRTVRHMLQNQYKPEQDSESDLFSLLEPTYSPCLNLGLMLTTPDRNQEADDAHKRSSTVCRNASRFSCSKHGATLVSPPVLKQVKNKALHEKYIDVLNCREANRKAASAKAGKLNKSKAIKQESSAERKVAIKAAKNALVFGAKDAINEFQHQQATALNDLFDCESGDDADVDNDQVF